MPNQSHDTQTTVTKYFVSLSFTILCAFGILYAHYQPVTLDNSVKFITQGTFNPQKVSTSQQVTLPHDWLREHKKYNEGWYRFNFFVDERPRALYAIYFPTVSQNAAVYLNGIEVGNGGSFSEPVSRNWPRPLIFPVAPELIQEDKNELLIQMVSSPSGRGLLPGFYVGPREGLLPAFWYRYGIKVTVANAITIVMGVYGILLLLIPLRRSEETQYLWGGAIILGFTSHSIPTIVANAPFEPIVWEMWRHFSIGLTTLFINFFTNRFIPVSRTKQEQGISLLLIVYIFASGITIATDNHSLYFQWGDRFWGILSLALGSLAAYNFMLGLRFSPTLSNHAIMASGMLLIFFGAHDVLSVAGLIQRQHGYLIHYATPIFALIFSFIFFIRFADSRNNVETLNKELKSRVEMKAKELDSSYKQITKLEKQQAAIEERERITRDMHDGIGGYLASALALAERHGLAELEQNLRDASEEMRTIIDVADSENDLTHAIGSMREKIERRLKTANIKLQWSVRNVKELAGNNNNLIINVVRIIQECLNNVIKHSNATVVDISLFHFSDEFITLKICDNGKCHQLNRPSGKGLSNIRDRANIINAHLNLNENGELGGLSVVLLLPVMRQCDNTHS